MVPGGDDGSPGFEALRPDSISSVRPSAELSGVDSVGATEALEAVRSVDELRGIEQVEAALRAGQIDAAQAEELLISQAIEEQLSGVASPELRAAIEDDLRSFLSDAPLWRELVGAAR